MDAVDQALLDRLKIIASTDPCQVLRVDLLWLLVLAGLSDTESAAAIAEAPREYVLVRRAGCGRRSGWRGRGSGGEFQEYLARDEA
jgi:hypothetical protein